MKTTNKILAVLVVGLITMGSITSCNKFLDIAPTSSITPENYFNDESHLSAYAANLYTKGGPLPGISDNSTFFYVNDFGFYGDDFQTDDQTNILMPAIYTSDQLTLESWEHPDLWDFSVIYECNYILDLVLPRFKAGTISGSQTLIKQAIGEYYFFRAVDYFKRLRAFGDFPIVKNTLKNEMGVLLEAAVRQPRNEVARFILQDLDSAVFYLSSTSPDGRNNRIHKDVATFLQSRVALFEGTWLKNFKGTAFVPQGPEWPGAQNAATKNYKFPSGSIDAEVDYFLTVAMKTAKVVADKYPLTPNTGVRLTKEDDVNPYVSQFGDPDLGKYQEVLIWRAFASGLKSHNVNRHLTRNNAGIGLTRALVRSFVDKNGLPPYATGALWGDAEENDMYKVTKDRDSRAQLFIKTPGQINTFKNNNSANASICFFTEPVPPIWIMNDAWGIYDTGYAHAKGMYPDADFCATSKGVTASPAYRSAEAYLNYIEACYEKTGAIDGDADRYWKAIRVRAKVAEERGGDYQVTIAATDMKEEGKLDWAAYTAGKLVDPTLYNIRRERRCEMMAEGRRFTDLCRWRAMDQMMTTRYRQEGIKIWHSPNEKVIADAAKAEGGFITIGETVSAPEKSNFLCPHEIVAGDPGMDLFTWKMAHYLKPIFIKHLLITSPQTHDAAGSSLYQNPYWPLDAGSIATK